MPSDSVLTVYNTTLLPYAVCLRSGAFLPGHTEWADSERASSSVQGTDAFECQRMRPLPGAHGATRTAGRKGSQCKSGTRANRGRGPVIPGTWRGLSLAVPRKSEGSATLTAADIGEPEQFRALEPLRNLSVTGG